jgi:hypothetical protein
VEWLKVKVLSSNSSTKNKKERKRNQCLQAMSLHDREIHYGFAGSFDSRALAFDIYETAQF